MIGEMFVSMDGQMLRSSAVSGLEEGVGGPGVFSSLREMLGPRRSLAPSSGQVLEASTPCSKACY